MKILLIDDEESILNLVRMNLVLEGFDVITSSTGNNGIMAFQDENPDLVLLDLMLPDLDGYEVMKKIQQINREIPIILLTAKGQLNDKLLGLQLGADDYITKPFDSREIILRIRAISRRINQSKRHNENSENEIEKGFIKLLKAERKIFIDSIEVQFTFREFETLNLLMQNINKVFSRTELLKKLWGYDYEGNTRAVDIHIERIRKKLKNHGNAIQTIYGAGYRLEV
ncbi:response regulator transcription factor [Clostridium estertheticum]|uniref:Stage 0 sporulation protein A homolog n=1 Tax=Clostridium estertheticum subsp. estertheticum TaxID=1552 RepID=A0A1J0GG23_9CLOT|nr:response regulator transcription factor [Clostridium estertheticum]APC39846.1 DNA-binding response regulator [Clostridium estertheticum subsp. estertheticum]MBU3072676.1 response regulator transcription factor [Clostridium estertheticum]MBU3162769.1 response regulator transcription factor [Clostridium estertheticum]MBU3171986.1 response regulator transcription factor [Clostridium estertheticum]MBZ9614100.1 response regulator transcription factor [Clostridium estertheticum subsp. laramiense]